VKPRRGIRAPLARGKYLLRIVKPRRGIRAPLAKRKYLLRIVKPRKGIAGPSSRFGRVGGYRVGV
jgi:hypothetical protein